jgi:hypothetical protein
MRHATIITVTLLRSSPCRPVSATFHSNNLQLSIQYSMHSITTLSSPGIIRLATRDALAVALAPLNLAGGHRVGLEEGGGQALDDVPDTVRKRLLVGAKVAIGRFAAVRQRRGAD